MSAANSTAILRHVPSELLEEILLKLPIKSLLRFSTVSKSWLSMISGSRFVQEQKRRAAVNSGEMMVTVSLHDYLDRNISICRIPLTSSMEIEDSTPLICPIEGGYRRLRAFCDGLWLVETVNIAETKNFRTENSLYLWNPATRTHRKLPASLLSTEETKFTYGLGYESAADDYKVLKIAREESSSPIPTELYSLKSDSWKTISPPPGIKRQQGAEVQERSEYVNGSFHWIRTLSNTIVTFDLSTEKCGEIKFPAIALDSYYDWNYVEVVVVRGKLCVTVNNSKFISNGICFALWVMEEYGVEKSWNKELNIEYGASVVSRPLYEYFFYPITSLRPVYLYDNGDILFNTLCEGLCMYKKETTLFKRIVDPSSKIRIGRGFIYVESLVSPLSGSHHEPSRVQI